MHAHRGSDKDAQVSHGHSHGAVDGEILASGRGIRATKISLAVLLVTAVVQLVIVGFTGSVASWPTPSTTSATPPPPCHCGRRSLCHGNCLLRGSTTGTAGLKTWLACSSFCPSWPPASSPPTSPSTGWATRRRSITYESWPWPPSSGSRAMKVWLSTG